MTRKNQILVKGTFGHRRTETDYMGVLLDAVSLEDWCEIVKTTVAAAKFGDPGARNWLALYLVGKAGSIAPAPLTVVAHQLSGHDRLVELLAQPQIDRELYPILSENEEFKDVIKAQVEAELHALEAQHSNKSDSSESRDGA